MYPSHEADARVVSGLGIGFRRIKPRKQKQLRSEPVRRSRNRIAISRKEAIEGLVSELPGTFTIKYFSGTHLSDKTQLTPARAPIT